VLHVVFHEFRKDLFENCPKVNGTEKTDMINVHLVERPCWVELRLLLPQRYGPCLSEDEVQLQMAR
jgi:hypothetical protein